MLRIGSFALTHHFSDAPRGATLKDSDYICTIEEYESFVAKAKQGKTLLAAYPVSSDHFVVKLTHNRIYEFDIAWPGNTSEELLLRGEQYVASPNTLLMLKLSHRYKKNSPHFLKTMRDIQFLRSKGAEVTEDLQPILKRREKETYSYSHPKLNQGKKTFFTETDKFYKYEHDDIHVAVAVGSSPAYTAFAKQGQEVLSSKKLWDRASSLTKTYAGVEEAYVLAIERSLVPHPGVLSPKQAFDKALEKVCTSITSGWFREFCWENYDRIQQRYNESFYYKFLAALERGEIREYNATSN